MVEKMSFKSEDSSALVKYNEIWNKIKKTDIKFHSIPVNDKKIHKNQSKKI